MNCSGLSVRVDRQLRVDNNSKQREKAADKNGCRGKEGITMTADDERRCKGGRRLHNNNCFTIIVF